MTLEPGTRLGLYELDVPLGRGGMGEVYRAIDTRLGRSVAIKILPSELANSPARLSRFEREAQLLASLNHPNIATIYGFFRDPVLAPPSVAAPSGADGAVPYLVMELVDGENLAARIARSPLPVEEAVTTFLQVAEGLEAAHERGIVHRDLKPANLMISTEGRVKILDFGIAKGVSEATDGDETPLRTATGLAVGTPGYMSPEQVRGGLVDKRSDIWSFGCVLFECLSGRSPFAGETSADRTAAMLTRGPELGRLPRDVPPPLRQLVQRCLVADPRQRLRDIGEARVQLEAIGRRQLEGDTVSTGWHQVDAEWRPRPEGSIPGRPNWLLTERLGSGGFGEVWLARHRKIGARRVFKFCLDVEKVAELRREVTLLRILRQALGERPDIAQLIDWQLDTQPAFLETEHTEGGDLECYAARHGGAGEIPLEDRLEIVAGVAVALGAAHSVGVLHQDLKPSNILVTEDAGTGRPKARLTDFGVGHVLDRDLLSSPGITVNKLTQTLLSSQSSGGTPLYAAPEIFAGKPATIQTDLYSLGVVLYQLVVGDLSRPLAPGWERDVGDELLRADIAACVDGSPERRPGSAAELADRLRGLEARRSALEEQERVRRHALEERRRAEAEAAHFARRRRQFLIASMGGLVLTLVVAAVAWRERAAAAAERTLREELRRRLYVSDMNLAGRAFSQGSIHQVSRLLENQLPGVKQSDLRRWEWYHLWHATHLEQASLLQRGGPSSPPAVSPQGDLVATIDFFGVLHLYDERLRPLDLGLGPAASSGVVAVSPDGASAASLTEDGVAVWDLKDGRSRDPVRLMRPSRTLVSEGIGRWRGDLAFSSDEPLLAAGFRDGKLLLWSTSTWELVAIVQAPGRVDSVVFGPEPGQLVVAMSPGREGDSPVLATYASEGLRPIRTTSVPEASGSASWLARASKQGGFATAGPTGVTLWSSTLETEATLPTPRSVEAIALSGDGRHLAAGLATTAEILVWRLIPEVSLLTVLRGHEQRVSGLAFSPDGETLYSTGQDGRIVEWVLAESVRFDRLPGVHLWGKLAFSDDGKFLSHGGGDWPSRLEAARWDVESRRPLETPSVATGFVNYASSEHGGVVVGMTADGEIRTGDLASGAWRPVARLTPEEAGTVGPMSVSSDGRRIAWDLIEKTAERRAAVLDVETGRTAYVPGKVRVDTGAVGPDSWPRDNQPGFSPDGTQLVVGQFNGSTAWDLTADPPALVYVARGWGQESCRAFSSDGSKIALCSQDNAIRVLDARRGELLTRLEGHAGFATSASFSADGRTLVSVGSDATVRVWDVELGQARATFDGFEQPAWRVAISPRGNALATLHGDSKQGPGASGELRIWRTARDPLLRSEDAAASESFAFRVAGRLPCSVIEGEDAPPGTPFELPLRLEQSGDRVEGELAWPWGPREVAGTVDGNLVTFSERTEGECPTSSSTTLEHVGGRLSVESRMESCRGVVRVACRSDGEP